MDIRGMAAVHLASMAAALIISHQHLHHTLRVVTAVYQSMAAVLTT